MGSIAAKYGGIEKAEDLVESLENLHDFIKNELKNIKKSLKQVIRTSNKDGYKIKIFKCGGRIQRAKDKSSTMYINGDGKSVKESKTTLLLKQSDGLMMQAQEDGDMIKKEPNGNQFQLTENQTLLICAFAGRTFYHTARSSRASVIYTYAYLYTFSIR